MHSSVSRGMQRLPMAFMRGNGMDKSGTITLLGKNGTKWPTNLRLERTNQMSLNKGWREFVIANGLKAGESFTLESIWKKGTPMLSLFSTESTSNTRQQGEYPSRAGKKELVSTEPSSGNNTSKVDIKKSYLRCKNSTPPSQNRFVTLTLTHYSLSKGTQRLPMAFMRRNGMDKTGTITLLGKNGSKWPTNLRLERTNQMSLNKGWKEFEIANGLKAGESFTLESILENGTPMLSLLNTDPTSDARQQGEFCSKAIEKESLSVNLNMLNACYISTKKHQHPRTKEAGGDDGKEDMGEYCSKASDKELVSTEPNSGNGRRKAEHSRAETRETSTAIHNRFVTLTLTLEDVRDCKLILPSQFMKANGINKLGKITLLGKNKKKWFGYLLTKDGLVALGCGWDGFCEANGVKTGDSFTLEFLYEQDMTLVFEFCPNSSD